MSDANNRNTFLPLRDILEHAAQRCLDAEAELIVKAGHASQPLSLACREIAREEHRLAKLFMEFTRNASGNLLNTRFQYTLDEKSQDRPGSPEEATAVLVNVNHRLTTTLGELSSNLAPEDLAESLGGLHREAETVAQRISMISTTMQDM